MSTDSDSDPDLARLGWSTDLQGHFDAIEESGLEPARVIVEHRGRYQVWGPEGMRWAWPPKGTRQKTSTMNKPGVGDWVALRAAGQGDLHHIAAVLPRRTALTRQAAGERAGSQLVAANLDAVFVVTSMNQDFNVRRLERYLSVVQAGGIEPIIVLNKADLAPPEAQARYLAEARSISSDVAVAQTSALRTDDVAILRRWLGPGRTVGLVGSSGVGKSSLANTLLGNSTQDIGGLRDDDRGRHTTTRRELLLLPDELGVLIDTPGMRELQLWTGEAIDEVFEDIVALLDGHCQYRDCRHNGEPGCAITEGLADGSLDEDRWASFSKLKAEAEA
ncbi:MAG: ribosome biogenesis GTPase, partial [Myxococcota bacterium]